MKYTFLNKNAWLSLHNFSFFSCDERVIFFMADKCIFQIIFLLKKMNTKKITYNIQIVINLYITNLLFNIYFFVVTFTLLNRLNILYIAC